MEKTEMPVTREVREHLDFWIKNGVTTDTVFEMVRPFIESRLTAVSKGLDTNVVMSIREDGAMFFTSVDEAEVSSAKAGESKVVNLGEWMNNPNSFFPFEPRNWSGVQVMYWEALELAEMLRDMNIFGMCFAYL